MTKKQKKQIMASIAAELEKQYPDALCALEWDRQPWKLMVMGSLSAQCTDARVNLVCRELFTKYPTAEALGKGNLSEIEEIVRPCGLFRTKAKNIKGACSRLTEIYGGILPDSMEELLTFPGVGRKVANLLLGDVYNKGGTVTDTHCIRICGRFGMYPESLKDPRSVERIMDELLEPEIRSDFCHRIVQFGRDTCTARAPKCASCPLFDLCAHGKTNIAANAAVPTDAGRV